jgi:hypothetical protein
VRASPATEPVATGAAPLVTWTQLLARGIVVLVVLGAATIVGGLVPAVGVGVSATNELQALTISAEKAMRTTWFMRLRSPRQRNGQRGLEPAL